MDITPVPHGLPIDRRIAEEHADMPGGRECAVDSAYGAEELLVDGCVHSPPAKSVAPHRPQLAVGDRFAAEEAIDEWLIARIAELDDNGMDRLGEARMMEQRHQKVGRLLDGVAL